ncbi:endolytic transglycosylase MltG [Candidatus Sororendozoicomonas aggregata]|uniref:endolytic transglycosylase MltG n=1 Tax=Candidatus Sororendozoicomonas aggregata TaxID=3073239 RepID=UPI002ED021D6
MLKKCFLGLLACFMVTVLAIGGGFWGLKWYAGQPVKIAMEQPFTIEKGDSLGRVASRLAEVGVLAYPQAFSVMGRVLGKAGSLRAGDYLIMPNSSLLDVFTLFTEGRVRYYDIALIEGHTLTEAITSLNQHPKLTDPLRPDALPAFYQSLGIQGSPEGLFYPDTYFFEAGTPVAAILTRAHKRLQTVLDEEWQGKAENLPFENAYQALVMASLVEKETGAAFERPDIAGVFVRRLQRNMRLQSDPTVIYGMGKRYEGNLSRKMLREKTPYNTYVINGLPPTPIALVGREAIHAALHPAGGETLYFVAKGDGTHFFSESLIEHNRAVRKYQVTERRDDYRSRVVN